MTLPGDPNLPPGMRAGDSDPPEGPDWRLVREFEAVSRRLSECLEEADIAFMDQDWDRCGDQLRDAVAALEDLQLTLQNVQESQR